MEFIFTDQTFVIAFFFWYLTEVMKIVRAVRVYAFMDTEEFTIFFSYQGLAAVRAYQSKRSFNYFAGNESLTTDLTLILTITTIVIVDVMMRSTTKRTYSFFGNRFTVTALNFLYRFTVFPLIVFEKELPILFYKSSDDRELVNLEFLVLWRVGIVESPLLERDISADKVNKAAVLLIKVLN